MTLNRFQQAEVDSHKDAELSWVIQETIERFREDRSNFSEDEIIIDSFSEEELQELRKTIC